MPEPIADQEQNMHNLLAFAVHEVFLDSDFVLFDTVSGSETDRFYFPSDWSSPVSVCYSLPKLLSIDNDSGPNFTDYVVLKFETLGPFLRVYGSLVKEGSGSYTLLLDEYRYSDPYNFGSWNSDAEKRVSEFRIIVNDGLVLPMLTDLSCSTGLPLPACLMSLPPELKLGILESLPGSDIARMACVCSELRDIVSSNDALKEKIKPPSIRWMDFPMFPLAVATIDPDPDPDFNTGIQYLRNAAHCIVANH
ncbi:hypothetical protein V6N13_102716 [Hibiscus sabdariffa]|uniref:F-box domain-containing protein n=1 Tax=Hibiscus sabdariffa TaxID=183260 RepID=A0ABR2D4X1_9ROSI